MYQKLSAALAVVCLGCVSLHANPDTGESKVLEARLTRTIAADLKNTCDNPYPYEHYQKKLATVQNPSYKTLRPLFVALSVYNADFGRATTEEEKIKLANMLAKETWAGWNNYRPIGMIEIFDSYFPQENKDKEIALLEYNIKSNLLSKEQRSLISVFENMSFEYGGELDEPYNKFVKFVQAATSYRPKDIIEAFVPMIEAYKQMEKDCQGTEFFVKRSAFKKPIAAGWGRTTTVDELRYHIGMEETAGGDYVAPYSVEQLQERYGVSPDVAEVFFDFVSNYYKK